MLKSLLVFMVVLRACAPITHPAENYPAILNKISEKRTQLSERYQAASTSSAKALVIDSAREFVFTTLTKEILPTWYGTEWDYNGTTTEPQKGHIACGYFVTTTLEAAGFSLPRAEWAQLASEERILNMTDDVRRYSRAPIAGVEKEVKERGRGLYVVGMDDHVGFIVNDGQEVTFVHSQPGGVTCEKLCSNNRCSRSRYRVVGKVLTDEMMRGWLEGVR